MPSILNTEQIYNDGQMMNDLHEAEPSLINRYCDVGTISIQFLESADV